MALAVYFSPAVMNALQYDEVITMLDKAGAGHPPGRSFHACFGAGDQLKVFDIWESMEAFQKFGETLQPVLAKVGFVSGDPVIAEIHNVIKG